MFKKSIISLTTWYDKRFQNLRDLKKDLWTALSGSDQDYTEGSLGRAILLLAIPMVLEMIMESVFAVVDIFFVSKLGADAVAIVGITESFMTIIYAVGIGLGMGATALVSRRIGEKNPEAASFAAVQAIIVGISVSVIFAIPGLFWSAELLTLMGVESAAIEQGVHYTTIIVSSNLVIMLLFIINAIFRSAGDAAVSMRVLWMANILNIILDPILIFGLGPIPAMGIEGAAIATSIGRGSAVVYQIWLLVKGNGRIKIHKSLIKFDWNKMWHLIKISLGGIGQNIIATSSWIGLMRIMAVFGSEVVAGYTIAIRIIIFTLLPSWGLSNAAATLVGQNLGAKKPERAEKAVWTTGLVNMAFLGVMAIFFISIPEFFIRLIISELEVINVGIVALKIISYGYLSYALGMVMIQAFNGAGDTKTPTIVNLVSFWLVEIPLAYLLAITLGFNANGIFWTIVISESVLTIIALILFRRGQWKLKVV